MNKKEFQNLKVGEIFYLGNIKLKVVESKEEGHPCDGCFMKGMPYFLEECICDEYVELAVIPLCSYVDREDKKNVAFVEVENENN